MIRNAARGFAAAVALAAAIVLLGIAALLGVAGPAAAHDVLVSVTPADGSTVEVAPDAVVLELDRPAVALGTQILVVGPDGATVSSGDPVLVNSTVTQALAGDRPAGAYTVEWRVTSADGHPVSGTFGFTATAAVAPAAPAPAPATATAAVAPSPSAAPTAAPTAVPSGSPSSAAAAGGDLANGPTIWIVAAGAVAVALLTGTAVWWVRRGQPAP